MCFLLRTNFLIFVIGIISIMRFSYRKKIVFFNESVLLHEYSHPFSTHSSPVLDSSLDSTFFRFFFSFFCFLLFDFFDFFSFFFFFFSRFSFSTSSFLSSSLVNLNREIYISKSEQHPAENYTNSSGLSGDLPQI